MRVITHSITYPSRGDIVRITPLGDSHLGNALCDEKLLAETVAKIEADPLHYWGGMGDMGDFINRSDKRHRESHMAPWLHGIDDMSTAQVDKIVKILEPIKDKCLWLVRGNHEDLIHKKYEHDVYAEICRKLGACVEKPLELGYRGFVRLRIRRNGGNTYTVVIYVHHGYGGGRLPGAKALKMGRLPTSYRADIYLYGHSHVKLAQPAHTVEPAEQTDTVVGRDIWGCMTGTFLRSYDVEGRVEVYSEEKDFPPTAIGPIEIQITPDKKRIKVLA